MVIASPSATGVPTLVVASDGLLADLYRRALDRSGEVRVAGTLPSPAEAARLLSEGAADAVAVIMRSPRPEEVFEAVRTLKAARVRAGVVVVTDTYDHRIAEALSSAGIGGWGYLPVESLGDVSSLEAALRATADGLIVLDQHSARSAPASIQQLTRRQREVLELMAQGFSNAEIARRLVLEPKSVENHINAIFNQLGVNQDPSGHPRVRAVLMYLRLYQGAAPANGADRSRGA
jgi:DNA-binding NarL/FixJ family response regulator